MAATTAVSGTAMTLHPGADTAVLPALHQVVVVARATRSSSKSDET